MPIAVLLVNDSLKRKTDMNTTIMHQTTIQSMAGNLSFPEVVQMLVAEGVESYRADLIRFEKIFYMPNGESYSEKFSFEASPVAVDFSETGVVAAIRAIQAKRINYQEFLRQIMAAGTTHYSVYLNGKRAIYFGRKGEFHVEYFPSAPIKP